MDFVSLTALLAFGAIGWFWFHSLRILEIAREAGKQASIREAVQFLDDTVVGAGMSLARDSGGRRVLRRIYRFEFSETGNSRREGEVIMLGDRVESVTMEPYQMLADSHFAQDDALSIPHDHVESHRSDHGG